MSQILSPMHNADTYDLRVLHELLDNVSGRNDVWESARRRIMSEIQTALRVRQETVDG